MMSNGAVFTLATSIAVMIDTQCQVEALCLNA